MSAFYQLDFGAHAEERFFASELTRGPWSNAHQHGGPASGLLARAIERVDGQAGGQPNSWFVTRMTVELLRPIPIAAPLEVMTDVLARGRTVQRIAAALLSGDEQLAVAVAVRVRVHELAIPIHPQRDDIPRLPPLERCRPFEFPFFRHAVGYHTAMEVRAAEGEFGRGDFGVWMRPRVALIDGEVTTPLQRVMICADAGHGVGTALDTSQWSFINPDLSVHVHRLPVDEWLGMQARTSSNPLGFGVCRTIFSDRHGELGLGVQSQVIAPAR
jgi:hypothetical protein